MPRRRRFAKRLEVDEFEFVLGPDCGRPLSPFAERVRLAALERAWHSPRGEAALDKYVSRQPGRRPWAWWAFDSNERMPGWGAETVRLAELGVLDADEIAAVIDRAARIV